MHRSLASWIAVPVVAALAAMPTPARAADPPLGTGGRAGIGLLVGSAVALGGGAALVAVHEPRHLDPDDSQREIARLTRGPGIALLVLGAAAAAGGIALLVLDRKHARTEMMPWVGRTGGGLVFSMRFGGRT